MTLVTSRTMSSLRSSSTVDVSAASVALWVATTRVPGANLTVSPPRQPSVQDPGDPAEVRDLITEFEAGVARALREVSTHRRNEEGSTR